MSFAMIFYTVFQAWQSAVSAKKLILFKQAGII